MRRSQFLQITALLTLAPALLCPQEPESRERFQSRLWQSLKHWLLWPNGTELFEAGLKDANVPGGTSGLNDFEGTLAASTPAEHPTEFLIVMPPDESRQDNSPQDNTPEVTLKLTGHLEEPLPIGARVRFHGIVRAFQRQPFMLTFEVQTVKRAPLRSPKTK